MKLKMECESKIFGLNSAAIASCYFMLIRGNNFSCRFCFLKSYQLLNLKLIQTEDVPLLSVISVCSWIKKRIKRISPLESVCWWSHSWFNCVLYWEERHTSEQLSLCCRIDFRVCSPVFCSSLFCFLSLVSVSLCSWIYKYKTRKKYKNCALVLKWRTDGRYLQTYGALHEQNNEQLTKEELALTLFMINVC